MADLAPAARLPELLKAGGCADAVAPVDRDAFGQKAGELICRNKAGAVTPTAARYRLRALQCEETAAQTRDPYAKDVLTELAEEFMQAARRADRLLRRAA
jgi:repressor of nif and glnA expression